VKKQKETERASLVRRGGEKMESGVLPLVTRGAKYSNRESTTKRNCSGGNTPSGREKNWGGEGFSQRKGQEERKTFFSANEGEEKDGKEGESIGS